MRAHAADIRQRHSQNQRLLAGHSGQVEAEQRLYRAAQADESRLGREIELGERGARDSATRTEALEASCAKLTKRLDASKRRIKLDRERLLEWEERLNRKEEKNAVIEQFVRSDEKTFKV